jgi:drug/metabolite transporter (DMT)-like permease
VSIGTAVGLVLALVSTVLTNLAYLREHDAAAELPVLCMRRPLHSARLLLEDRSWMLGFAMESTGFLLYAAALSLASLTLVQSIAAGGIGVLAYGSARLGHRRLSRRELFGVVISVVGLGALAVSLAGGSGEGSGGATGAILIWLGATAGAAVAVLSLGRRALGPAVANGVAGGLLFSIGDISTKLATQGGARVGFVLTLILGYTLGTALLQVGYQAGGALTVAGVATLLTNALPIAAGALVLDEPVPSGFLGGLRVLAFAAVVAGAVLLARPQKPSEARAERAA